MNRLEQLQRDRAAVANHLAQIDAMIDEEESRIAEENANKAYRNAFETMFDGVKYTNDEQSAIDIKLPMVVKANIMYKIDNEGVPTYYVCVKNGKATEDNFDEYFEQI